jgi:hypothetical protein
MKVLSLASLCITQLLVSCSVYKSHFECPIPKGVECLSVSEIESKIIENKSGEDLFLLDKSACNRCKKKEGSVHLSPKNDPYKRFWIKPYTAQGGEKIDGHFVYFKINPENEERG